MATLADVLAAVRAALARDPALAALSRPEQPVDVLVLPAQVVYVGSGGEEIATHDGDWDGAYTIAIETHVVRQNGLAAAYAALMDYLPRVNRQLREAYGTDRFGGTVLLVGAGRRGGGGFPIRFEVAQDEWGGTQTLALTHEIDVTITEE